MEQYEQIEVSSYDPVTGETGTMTVTQVNYTAGRETNVGPWGLCHVCGRSFPQSRMTKVKGKWYCVDDRNEVE